MLLGKRPRSRPPMKRTTSMSEITLDLNTSTDVESSNPLNRQTVPGVGGVGGGGFNGLDQSRVLLATDHSPRSQTRHSANSVETPDFLRACSLCKRCLVPGRDIYMYRGDSAFCSLECRQQQMKQDERKEKFILASKKQVVAPPPGSQVATKGETVAAL